MPTDRPYIFCCLNRSFCFKKDNFIFLSSRMSSICHSNVIRMSCYPYVTRMYSYVIRMSLVSTCTSSVCHSYVLVCHPYVTGMYSYVIRMSLVCGFTINWMKLLNKVNIKMKSINENRNIRYKWILLQIATCLHQFFLNFVALSWAKRFSLELFMGYILSVAKKEW